MQHPEWHPIMSAVEGPIGCWRMIDSLGREFGTVHIRRVSGGLEVRYRVAWRGELLGWASSLREACMRLHQTESRSFTPGGRSGAPEPWELEQRRRRAP